MRRPAGNKTHIIPGFKSDGNARECRSRSFLYNGNVPNILQLLTVIFHGSPSIIKLIRLLPAVDRKFYNGPYATNVFIKINMPSAESSFSEKELNLLK